MPVRSLSKESQDMYDAILGTEYTSEKEVIQAQQRLEALHSDEWAVRRHLTASQAVLRGIVREKHMLAHFLREAARAPYSNLREHMRAERNPRRSGVMQ